MCLRHIYSSLWLHSCIEKWSSLNLEEEKKYRACDSPVLIIVAFTDSLNFDQNQKTTPRPRLFIVAGVRQRTSTEISEIHLELTNTDHCSPAIRMADMKNFVHEVTVD